MSDEMKLLRAFIEASGYEIETSNGKISCGCSGYTGSGCGCCNFTGFISKPFDYKVTKRPMAMTHPIEYPVCDGDLFSLGCQVANDDIKDRLKLLGFDLNKDQMHDVMEAIIFHMAK